MEIENHKMEIENHKMEIENHKMDIYIYITNYKTMGGLRQARFGARRRIPCKTTPQPPEGAKSTIFNWEIREANHPVCVTTIINRRSRFLYYLY